MPKQKRWAIKQKIDDDITRVEKTRESFLELAAIFKPAHPEYFDIFMHLADYLDKFIAPAKNVRDLI